MNKSVVVEITGSCHSYQNAMEKETTASLMMAKTSPVCKSNGRLLNPLPLLINVDRKGNSVFFVCLVLLQLL